VANISETGAYLYLLRETSAITESPLQELISQGRVANLPPNTSNNTSSSLSHGSAYQPQKPPVQQSTPPAAVNP